MRIVAALLSVGSLVLFSASASATTGGGVDQEEFLRLAASAGSTLRAKAQEVWRLRDEAAAAARHHSAWLRELARREEARHVQVEEAARRARAEYQGWLRSRERPAALELDPERARRVAKEIEARRERARLEEARRLAAEREARELVRRVLDDLPVMPKTGPRAGEHSSPERPTT